ncbi:MAG TPA: carbamoyltransferase HypF, partial [Verrucomicrobiae bacterium]|nr:carbamoyltransferase HypF [Verrucomicrobiae bacterium]
MTPLPSARLKLVIHGAVQGVGFRPCVRRLATAMGLSGWVRNSPQGVDIEVEGPRAVLEQFLHRLEKEKPEHCRIQRCETSWLPPVGDDTFEIEESAAGGVKTALVLPDLATCPDCLREMFDPANRRYLYPFTNCTHCGPRFSIIEALPYDRANTSMKAFAMCPACQAEYDNPDDRRYHAQPNACPVCGPQLELWEAAAAPSESPRAMARNYLALLVAARAIRRGQIVALKGIGGFHLIVDARNDVAVRRLRGRKHREEKPLALLFPDLESVRAACDVSAPEAKLLLSREAPIVLLRRRPGSSCACCEPDELCAAVAPAPNLIAPAVAPGNPNLGVMLPSNPLHHLLLAELGFPVVATSGNLTDEPICTDEREALERLRGIADVFLVHNRPIVRHVDDSIVRVMLGEESIVRRARGYAPLPVETGGKGGDGSAPILAVGGQLKNAVALECRGQAFISQHIGDLESTQANLAFRRVIADFEKMYDATPALVVADRHPDYLSTRFAQAHRPLLVQHHVAHVLSCLADNQLTPPALGVAWDGTGYGDDGTIWGGEFFRITAGDIERVAHLRPFRLPGGEAAIKEPRRAAIGLLYELFGDVAFGLQSLAPLREFK